MKAQWGKLAWIALAIVLIVVGCGPSATQPPPTAAPTPAPPTQPPALPAATSLPFPTGIFTKGSTWWEFKADGTYTVELHLQGVDQIGSGPYTVTGDQVVIQDPAHSCKDIVGTYAWSYDGDVLSMTPVDDKCSDRKNMIWGKWQKKP